MDNPYGNVMDWYNIGYSTAPTASIGQAIRGVLDMHDKMSVQAGGELFKSAQPGARADVGLKQAQTKYYGQQADAMERGDRIGYFMNGQEVPQGTPGAIAVVVPGKGGLGSAKTFPGGGGVSMTDAEKEARKWADENDYEIGSPEYNERLQQILGGTAPKTTPQPWDWKGAVGNAIGGLKSAAGSAMNAVGGPLSQFNLPAAGAAAQIPSAIGAQTGSQMTGPTPKLSLQDYQAAMQEAKRRGLI